MTTSEQKNQRQTGCGLNKPQQKHRLGTVSNKLLGRGFNRFYTYTTLSLGSPMVHKHIRYLIRVKDFQLIDGSKQQPHKLRFKTKMKQDEYSTARLTLKHWIKRNLTVEHQWARPKPINPSIHDETFRHKQAYYGGYAGSISDILKTVCPLSNLLLTIPRWCFCCGSFCHYSFAFC